MAGRTACRYLLLVVLFTGCEVEPLEVIFHPSVETRVRESLNLPSPDSLRGLSLPFRFAVFADVHIGEEGGCYLNQFARAVDSLNIDFFCVGGDLTHYGSIVEYDSVATLFRAITPFFVTLGNHDLYSSGSWQKFKEIFGPSCYAIKVANSLKLIFLDTGEGRLGANQFAFLERELADSNGIRIVITHFPLYDDETPSIFRLASNAERARLQSLLQRYRVFAICSGHIHGFRHYEIGGVHHFTIGTMSRKLDFGEPGFLLFECATDTIKWQFVRFGAGQ